MGPMDPTAMMSGGISAIMPVAEKGMDMGMDVLKKLTEAAGGAGKPGEDQQQPAPAQIPF